MIVHMPDDYRQWASCRGRRSGCIKCWSRGSRARGSRAADTSLRATRISRSDRSRVTHLTQSMETTVLPSRRTGCKSRSAPGRGLSRRSLDLAPPGPRVTRKRRRYPVSRSGAVTDRDDTGAIILDTCEELGVAKTADKPRVAMRYEAPVWEGSLC